MPLPAHGPLGDGAIGKDDAIRPPPDFPRKIPLQDWVRHTLEAHLEDGLRDIYMQLASLQIVVDESQVNGLLGAPIVVDERQATGFLGAPIVVDERQATGLLGVPGTLESAGQRADRDSRAAESDTSRGSHVYLSPDTEVREIVEQMVSSPSIVNARASSQNKQDTGSRRISQELCRSRLSQFDTDVHQSLFSTEEVITSPIFDTFIGTLILANTIVIMVQTEWQGHRARTALGESVDPTAWRNAKIWFDASEHIFNGFFIVELVLRLRVTKWRFFRDTVHLFDASIVAASSLQLYVADPLRLDTGGGNLIMIRFIRFVRFVRILRIVRTLSLFYELRVLIITWVVSFRALIWSMLLLTVLMLICGLVLCQLLQEYIIDEHQSIHDRKWAYKFYGSASRSMFTMFEATLSGCWPTYFRPLVEEIHPAFGIIVVVYVCIVIFGFIRIITALFLKQTLGIAESDASMQVNEKKKKKKALVDKLENLFRALDTSGDGMLSLSEFTRVTTNEKVRVWLEALELEIHDVELLFDIMDDGDGMVTREEFLHGILRLKGHGRAFDIVKIMRSGDFMKQRLVEMGSMVLSIQNNILTILERLRPISTHRSIESFASGVVGFGGSLASSPNSAQQKEGGNSPQQKQSGKRNSFEFMIDSYSTLGAETKWAESATEACS